MTPRARQRNHAAMPAVSGMRLLGRRRRSRAQSLNSPLMLSRWWIRRIASANSGAAETTRTLGESRTGWVSTVSVVISSRIGLASRRRIDPSAKTPWLTAAITDRARSEEHTSELQSRPHLVCRLLLEKKKRKYVQQSL